MHTGKTIIANFLLILFMVVQCSFNFNTWRLLRHHAIDKNNRAQHTVLRFALSEWQSIEKVNDDEIKVNNRMFDIRSISVEEHEVIVTGHFDKEEDEILADTDASHKKDACKKTEKFQTELFLETIDEPLARSNPDYAGEHCLTAIPAYFFMFSEIENPPPQAVL